MQLWACGCNQSYVLTAAYDIELRIVAGAKRMMQQKQEDWNAHKIHQPLEDRRLTTAPTAHRNEAATHRCCTAPASYSFLLKAHRHRPAARSCWKLIDSSLILLEAHQPRCKATTTTLIQVRLRNPNSCYQTGTCNSRKLDDSFQPQSNNKRQHSLKKGSIKYTRKRRSGISLARTHLHLT